MHNTIVYFCDLYVRVSIINGTIVVRVHLSQFGISLDSLKGSYHTASHKYVINKWMRHSIMS